MRLLQFIVSRKGVLAVLIVIIAIVVNYLLLSSESELMPVEQSERIWPVKALPAIPQDVQPDIHLFGEVVAGRRSELRSQVNGIIVEMGKNFREGGVVVKDELLIAVDPFDYETALKDQRWRLQEAESRLEQLRREDVRAKNLFKEKNVSEEFRDSAELAVVQQEAIVGQRVVGVQRAERDVLRSRLIAPYDGVISNINANLGNSVSNQGDKLAELIDTSQLEVRFSLSNAQYGRLLESDNSIVGKLVDVTWQVGDRNLAYKSVIKRIGGEIVSSTGGVNVYAVIDTGGEQTDLRSGAFVSVLLKDKVYRDVFEMPETVLYGEEIVYVIDGDRLAARRIKIEGYSGINILFSSAGEPHIKNGDLILMTQLREGGTGVKVAVQ